ncbi:MAG TPA: GtrA family protein [Porphyromonadaceae bacterium]|nr:GtrA family protein [Porphyromonadaceae bacterium]
MDMIKQAAKYGVVGAGNTILSLVIIWVMTKKLGCTEAFSNFTGYFIGLINSFFLNRKWTFNSTGNVFGSAVKFFLVFAVCYLLQLGVLLLLNRYCPQNPPLYSLFEPMLKIFKIDTLFYIQLLSMVVYTAVNFLINKYYTFKK